jgi:hypothetical protein
MIYGKDKWFLNMKNRNGKTLANGEILGTWKNLQYKFGESVFSSRNDLEIALQAKYGEQARQCFN